jgi:hypothetical protein
MPLQRQGGGGGQNPLCSPLLASLRVDDCWVLAEFLSAGAGAPDFSAVNELSNLRAIFASTDSSTLRQKFYPPLTRLTPWGLFMEFYFSSLALR